MKWFAAHCILYTKFLDNIQDVYPTWENIYVIQANDYEEAYQKAVDVARNAEEKEYSSSKVNDRPVLWTFADIRKIAEIIGMDDKEITDGCVITSTDYLIHKEKLLERFINTDDKSMWVYYLR